MHLIGVRSDEYWMRQTLRWARRGYGRTSPNPMVGALLVKAGKVIGRGWHRQAGMPHAEIEAMKDAHASGHSVRGATLYVSLEPCSTYGRTPPCTAAIIRSGVRRVVVGATDPNPKHRGKGFALLRRAGIRVTAGVLKTECDHLNESFNYWIVQRTPFVTVKAAMTLDGKIATSSGESKWITGEKARAYGMKLRQGADAILVGINTVLADDPSLTFRISNRKSSDAGLKTPKTLRRIVVDSQARTPLGSRILTDGQAALTTIVVGHSAPKRRIAALAKRAQVWIAPTRSGNQPSQGMARAKAPTGIDLEWLLRKLGAENITHLLVEGGGEVNASFLMKGLAQRIAFFYAPKILGGLNARRGVAGAGAATLEETLQLDNLQWRRLGADWLLTARVRRK